MIIVFSIIINFINLNLLSASKEYVNYEKIDLQSNKPTILKKLGKLNFRYSSNGNSNRLILKSRNKILTSNIMSSENNYKKIDKRIFEIGKHMSIDNIMYPIMSILESIFISKISGLDKLAIQTLGDQMFGIFFNFFSFIPPILLPQITKLSKKKDDIIDISIISILISILMGLTVSSIVILNSNSILFSGLFISVDKISNEIKSSLSDYLKFKFISFPVCLYSGVISTILRANMNFDLLIKSNFFCNFLYIILSPFFVNLYGLYGINLLCLFIEILKSVIFSYNLIKIIGTDKLKIYFYRIVTSPSQFMKRFFKKFYFFFSNGIFLQLKNIIRKTTYIKINSKIFSIDNKGIILGSHIILCKFYDLFYILFKTLNSVSSILIPKTMTENSNDSLIVNDTKNRIIYWINNVGLKQIIICTLMVSYLFLINKEEVWNNNTINSKLLSFFVGDSFDGDKISFINNILPVLVFTNLTCYLNSLIGFHEIILQSFEKYKFHSILSVFFSLVTLCLIPFYDNLLIVWSLSFLFASVKLFLIKKYVSSEIKISE